MWFAVEDYSYAVVAEVGELECGLLEPLEPVVGFGALKWSTTRWRRAAGSARRWRRPGTGRCRPP